MSEVIERRTISHIPENERHGKAVSLFPFWFSGNTSVLTMLSGAIGIEFGLSLPLTLVALMLGAAVGGIFMAYHSAQGPKLGLPQMIQTRAQFGFFGSLVPSSAVMVIFLGFIIGENVFGSQALAGLLHITFVEAMALNCFVTWLVVVFGYRILHDVNRVAAGLSLVFIVVLFFELVGPASRAHYHPAPFSASSFFLLFTIGAAGQIGWAPYVSDYSRYLPAGTSVKQTFWYTYLGTTIGAVIGQVIGALAGVVALSSVNADAVGFLASRVAGISSLVVLVLFFSILAGNAINLYSPLVTSLACVSPSGAPGAVVRSVGSGIIIGVTGWIATIVSSNFLADLADFQSFLLYLLIPWSAINLIDYYVVKKGKYSVRDILSVDGRYGLFNVSTVVVFVLAIAAEVPFMNSAWPKFEGPVAHALAGVDLSWLVGFVVAGGLYYLSATLRPAEVKGRTPRVRESEPEFLGGLATE